MNQRKKTIENDQETDGLSYKVIGAAIDVHRALGPGLLESAYENCLAHELMERGINFQRQVSVPIQYKGKIVDCGYRLDFYIEDTLVLELKTVEKLMSIHEAQLFTYLKISKAKLGMLINFNVLCLKEGGIRRMIL